MEVPPAQVGRMNELCEVGTITGANEGHTIALIVGWLVETLRLLKIWLMVETMLTS